MAMERMSAMVRFCFPRLMALSRLGMAMAAMMPMIATTMSSSISVKPFCLRIRSSLSSVHPAIVVPVHQVASHPFNDAPRHRSRRSVPLRGTAYLACMPSGHCTKTPLFMMISAAKSVVGPSCTAAWATPSRP